MSDTAIAPAPKRLVLFLTQVASPDVPLPRGTPLCLAPLGTSTFLERVLDSCALAGVQAMDLVVSDQPEAVRATVQDGRPWGLDLRWHHAKDPAAPYDVLRRIQWADSTTVVIGHAHQWISSRILRQLLNTPRIVIGLWPRMNWAGWCSLPVQALGQLGRHVDHEALKDLLNQQGQLLCTVTSNEEYACGQSAAALLNAQQGELAQIREYAVPATWRQMPWGAASPDAIIDRTAHIEGPALIGPGCVIESDARVGPNTVLSHDVYVASHATVRASLVLKNTYVGPNMHLENVVAQGAAVQNLKWSVRTTLDSSDPLLAPLYPVNGTTPSWYARAAALGGLVLLFPIAMPMEIVHRVAWGTSAWSIQRHVRGVRENNEGLHTIALRLGISTRATFRWVGKYAGLIDIVQGRRCWLGIRPRKESEWHALRSDWQELFGQAHIGLFHAPAWKGRHGQGDHDAIAASDAFMAVHPGTWQRLSIVLGLAHRRIGYKMLPTLSAWMQGRSQTHGSTRSDVAAHTR